MNYDTMEAGREMDALVAEKVMGRECSCGTHFVTATNPHGMAAFCHIHGNIHSCPPWSTSIAAAWEVVQKMGANYQICLEYPWWPGVPYRVVFTHLDSTTGKERFVSDGDTAPIAICRAALKAVEET